MINPRVDKLVASGFGLGYLPLAPATFGSLLALPIWFFLRDRFLVYAVVTVVIAALGVILAHDLARTEEKDPRWFVWDEVAGLLIALAPLGRFEWRLLLLAFFLFRGFDVAKPFPIRRLESLGAGIGVVADDLLAGTYAAVLVVLADRLIF